MKNDSLSYAYGSFGNLGDVDAQTIRTAILKAHEERKTAPGSPYSIAIQYANVHGRLELDGMFSDRSEALIGLIFVGCRFQDPIQLNGSCLTVLTFKDCQLSLLNAVRAKVLGTVQFFGVTSSELQGAHTGAIAANNWHKSRGPEHVRLKFGPDQLGECAQGRCEVNFRGAAIGGNIKIEECLFVARDELSDKDKLNNRGRYAFTLSGARLDGSLSIQRYTGMLGGVALPAECRDVVNIVGSIFISKSSSAIWGQRTHIHGYLGIRNECAPDKPQIRTEVHGPVDFMGAKIDSGIDITGTLFNCADHRNFAFGFFAAETDFFMSGYSITDGKAGYQTEITGNLNLGQSEIRHSFLLNARLHDPVGPMDDDADTSPALDLSGMRVSGHVSLIGEWAVAANLNSIHIDGDLNLGNGVNDGLRLMRPSDDRVALDLFGAKIKGALRPTNFSLATHANLSVLHAAIKSRAEFKVRTSDLPFAEDARIVEFMTKIDGKPHFGMVLSMSNRLVLLDGTGPFFFGPMKRNKVDLSNPNDAVSYIKTFCSIVMSKGGPFRIIEPDDWFSMQMTADQREKVQPAKILESNKPNTVLIEATIWYAHALFISQLELNKKTFKVSMIEDYPVATGLPLLTTLSRPLVMSTGQADMFDEVWHLPSPVAGALPRVEDMSKAQRKEVRKALPAVRTFDAERPVIRLSMAHVGRLEDMDGNLWPSTARMDLVGFLYDSMDITTDRGSLLQSRLKRRAQRQKFLVIKASGGEVNYRVGQTVLILIVLSVAWTLLKFAWVQLNWVGPSLFVTVAALLMLSLFSQKRSLKTTQLKNTFMRRRRWLRMQYLTHLPSRAEFNPQPLEQLAKTFRNQGQELEYRAVSRLLARWQNKSVTSLFWRPFVALYGQAFGFGFSIKRGIFTFCVAILLGWFAVQEAVKRDMLVVATSIDFAVWREDTRVANLPCRNEIVPFLYALDNLLPLIDLGQEARCRFRDDDKYRIPDFPMISLPTGATLIEDMKTSSDQILSWVHQSAMVPTVWKVGVSIYKLAGWIISSLLVLTFTKTFRRSVGE